MPFKDPDLKRAYDRERGKTPHKRAVDIDYKKRVMKTEEGRAKHRRQAAIYRARYPEKIKARNAVNSALQTGKLKRLACEVCGVERVEAHHADYTRPLDVRWLCSTHHPRVLQERTNDSHE